MEKVRINNDLNKIQKLFSGRLYQDKYIFIQEIVSNAKDSHTRANQTKPVEISVFYSKYSAGLPLENSLTFKVRDYGVGLTPEEFREKIGVLAYSDKEASLDEIGCMGIGSVSWAAYTDKCKFTCIKNSKKFEAIMQETEDDGIVFEISDEKETEEETGVIFELLLEEDSLKTIKQQILKRLCYFTNVWFNFNNDVSDNSKFEVIRTEFFQTSTLSGKDEVHLSLDDVIYPINWEKLGIPPVLQNFALRFAAKEGLEPTLTRESIRYKAEVKELILNKLKSAADWIINKWNESSVCTDIKEAILLADTKKLNLGGQEYSIKYIENYSSVFAKKVSYEGVSNKTLLAFSKNFRKWSLQKFEIKSQLRKSFFGNKIHHERNCYNNIELANIHDLYISDKAIPRKKLSYLKDQKIGAIFIKIKNLNLKFYINFLLLDKANKSEWRSKIIECQKVESLLLKNIKSLDDIIIPDAFKQVSERKPRVKREKTEIPLKYLRLADRGYNKSSLEDKVLNSEALEKNPFFTVFSKERDILDTLFKFKRNKFKLALVSDKFYNILIKENPHNFMSSDEFLKKDNINLRRFITAILIDEAISKYGFYFRNIEIISNISKYLSDMMISLKDYSKINSIGYLNSEKFKISLLEYAKDNNFYDLSIKSTLDTFLSEIDRFSFLRFFTASINSGDKEASLCINHLCRYRKIKMNIENYECK